MKPKITLHELKVEGYSEPVNMGGTFADRYAFIYLLEGESLTEIDGVSYHVSPGQFFMAPPKRAIVVKYFNKCKGFDGSFQLDFLKDASYPVLHSTKPHLQTFWFDDAVFMANLFKRMLTALDDKDMTFLKSGLDMIMCQMRAEGKVAVIPEKFLHMVFDGSKAPLSVSEYASELNVTPNYLNKTVKQHTHRTAIDWIEIARLNMAKMLLKDRTVPVGDVAGRVGVPDQSYFARFFKKKTGMTPSEFRNAS